MIDASWSQLIKTDLGRMAQIAYTTDGKRKYHVWNHILTGYEWAKRLELPYDVNLDMAWLGHDLVYDDKPDKELRSYTMLVDLYEQHDPIEGVDMNLVGKEIRKTIDHRSSDDDRIIMMDLADLTDKERTATNFELLRSEMLAIYNISSTDHAEATIEFLRKLRQTAMANGTVRESQFWGFVMRGIDQSITLAEEVLEF